MSEQDPNNRVVVPSSALEIARAKKAGKETPSSDPKLVHMDGATSSEETGDERLDRRRQENEAVANAIVLFESEQMEGITEEEVAPYRASIDEMSMENIMANLALYRERPDLFWQQWSKGEALLMADRTMLLLSVR